MTIHVDILGIPQPRATVHCVCASTYVVTDSTGTHTESRPDRWLLASTAVGVDAPVFAGRAEVESWMAAHGWQLVESSWRGIVYEHAETAAALAHRVAMVDAKWAEATPCYVRYGDLPEDGQSRNHADNTRERGVSVFHGEVLPTGQARALPNTHVEMASMLSISSRPLYIVAGDEIGVGSDGEPLLVNCRVIHRSSCRG